MSNQKKPDYILLTVVAALILFGLVMISSAGIIISQESYGQSYYFLKHQLIFGVLTGLAASIVTFLLPYRFWKKIAFFLIAITILGLVLVFVPGVGQNFGGAKRWIIVGPISLQPTEFLKLALVLYLAAWFDKKREGIKNFWKGFVPFLMIIGLIALLIILQPNLGTLGIVALVALSMYFLAGAKISHFLLAIGIGLSTFFAFIKLAPYRINRLLAFLDPQKDPRGISYQISQALLALGSGGLLGRGLGHSYQKFQYLPEPVTDSIAAIIGEELGFLGLLFLVGLFVVLAIRGFKIAKNSPDAFSRLLAGGITSWMIIQAFVNLAAISGLIPLTGIPLPFISYGGSSLAINMAAMGILLNVSRHTSK